MSADNADVDVIETYTVQPVYTMIAHITVSKKHIPHMTKSKGKSSSRTSRRKSSACIPSFFSLKYKLTRHKGMTIAHINVRSLFPKLDEIRWLTEELVLDIVCMSESWLNSNILDEDISIPEYSIIRNDRGDKTGGGVSCFVYQKQYYILT